MQIVSVQISAWIADVNGTPENETQLAKQLEEQTSSANISITWSLSKTYSKRSTSLVICRFYRKNQASNEA